MTIVFNQLVAFGPLFQDVLNQTQALERFNFISLAVMVEAAENRSNQSYNLVHENFTRLADQYRSIKHLLSLTQNI